MCAAIQEHGEGQRVQAAVNANCVPVRAQCTAHLKLTALQSYEYQLLCDSGGVINGGKYRQGAGTRQR